MVDLRAEQDAQDALLLWCSEVGSGEWSSFRAACTTLNLRAEAASHALVQLGHIEIDWRQSRFACAPPTLAGIPGLAGIYLLTGARPQGLLEELQGLVDAAELPITILEPAAQRGIGPSSVFVEVDPGDAHDVARRTGLSFSPCPAEQIEPHLQRAVLSEVASPVIPDDRFVRIPIDPDSLRPRWRDAGAAPGEGLWLEQGFGGRPSWLIREEGQWHRLEAAEWGPYLLRQGEPRLRYEAAHEILVVDSAAPLPVLHARTACLCSGRMPYRQHLGPGVAEDRYVNVPRAIARTITDSLMQDQEL